MGFLDNLLKREARKIISGVMDNVVDNVMDNINESMNSNKSTATISTASTGTTSTSPAVASEDPDEEDCCFDEKVVGERVAKVFCEEWKGYQLRKYIPATELGGSEEARDYTYGIFLDGEPKAMIMVIDVPSHYKKKDVLLAHEACKNRGVYCMNLMLHLPNRRSYISKQLRDNVAR